MGFLVNGYQLRVFDAEPRTPGRAGEPVEPDGVPSSRIARGITFSANGAAVTFDDCPRGRRAADPGLAVRKVEVELEVRSRIISLRGLVAPQLDARSALPALAS